MFDYFYYMASLLWWMHGVLNHYSTLLRLLVDSESGSTVAGPIVPSGATMQQPQSEPIEEDREGSCVATALQKQMVVTGGELLKMRSGLKLAYYQQNLQERLPYNSTPLEYITSVVAALGEDPSEQNVRGQLGSFGIHGDMVLRKIGTLSGGQKSRIVLTQLTVNK